MKKIVYIFIILFLFLNIRVKGIEVNNNDYLKEIKKDIITIGIQNKDESLQNFKNSNLAKYLREKLNLNVRLKKVSEKEGISELLSQKIDFLENASLEYLENVSLEDNEKIKYLNYNLLNNIIIVCREEDKSNYTFNQLANKKVGVIRKNAIEYYPIQILKVNNNVKFYRNFNEIAEALENKDIDLGLCDKENRFELLLYNDITLAEDRCNWSWKEGIATANPKYYQIIDIINKNISSNAEEVNVFFDSEKDCKQKIKKAFDKSLSSEEREYIKNNKNIKVLASKDSFPILYEEANRFNGLLHYFMNILQNLSKINIEYIDNKDNFISDDLIEEKITYENYNRKNIPNIIHRTNLVMVSYNNDNLDPALSYINRTDKSIIGIPKQIQLNKDSDILQNKIKYYENIDYAIKALKKHDVNFILMDRPTFDYYSLIDKGKNLIEFKELNNSAIYYLKSNNKILSGILKKVHKIYYIEKTVNKAQWNNIKDYMQKKYVNAIYKRKQFYKFLIIAFISSLIVAMIFIIISKKNMDKKLAGVLKEDSNLDIIEINLKTNKVGCRNGLIFDSSKKLDLDKFLKMINLNREDYLNKNKINMLKEPKEVLINEEVKYFKQGIQLLSNKKLISIITDVTKEVKEKNELQEKIRIDNLTGLTNRDYYEEEIEKIISKNPKDKGIFLFIDINNFKNFNDRFGHDFGDKVIKAIGNKLNSIENNNILAFRIAGDEFGVYKHGVQNKEDIEYFLKNLCDILTLEETYNGLIVSVSCSIGCATYSSDLKNIGMLRNNAEAEMYKCKKSKVNQSRYKF